MRILGIDYGEKRIGLAITDRQNSMAMPFGMLENNDSLSENILKLIKDNDIGRIVIGRPISLNGQPGHQAQVVDNFISIVLKSYELPVSIVDERFTSKISSDLVSASYGSRKEGGNKSQKKNQSRGTPKKIVTQDRKSGATDTISAALILGDYLNLSKIQESNSMP
jgi:putative Holliday junction resolvase